MEGEPTAAAKMSQQYMKITYHSGGAGKKFHTYLTMVPESFDDLMSEIQTYLCEEHNLDLPLRRIKSYWIDADGDEIHLAYQNDYDVFLVKRFEAPHVHVAAILPKDFVIHDDVECDVCHLTLIMRVRYKCIQCVNFNLCQNCEAQHIHVGRIILRMPTKHKTPSSIPVYK